MFRKITNISGAYCLKNFTALDNRGKFFKIFRHDQFPEEINSLHFRESFFTESKKNVLRGMHFQLPPYDLDKTATVISGKVLDVILDMRRSSPTFKQIFHTYLGENCDFSTIFVPKGCAHGFLALEDNSRMLYCTTCEFHPEYDSGIHYDSFYFDWPINMSDIIISEKDKNLPAWNPEESPFL